MLRLLEVQRPPPRVAVAIGVLPSIDAAGERHYLARDKTVTPPADPTAVVRTGLVQFLDRTDHHTQAMPGWGVRVVWFGSERTGDGQPDIEQDAIARSGPSGVYEVRYKSRTVVAAEVRAVICNYDPAVSDSCLEIPSCDPRLCQIWTAPRRLDVAPGQRFQQNVVVACDHVP